jgi:acetyl-CoA carboxylase biotin carboxyl carrier protein
MPGIDSELIKHALNVARQRGFAEVEIETEAGKFSASLEKVKKAPAPVGQPVVPEKPSNGLFDIKAPLVGYYSQAMPGLASGITVSKGDVIASISALGLANDVESPQEGEIVEVLVADGDPVMYGQVIARMKVNR